MTKAQKYVKEYLDERKIWSKFCKEYNTCLETHNLESIEKLINLNLAFQVKEFKFFYEEYIENLQSLKTEIRGY